MKINPIVNTRTALIAPLFALGLTAGAHNISKMSTPKQQDEIVLKHKNAVNKKTTLNDENTKQEKKTNKSYAGTIFLGLLATFCGISLLAGDKKRNGGK